MGCTPQPKDDWDAPDPSYAWYRSGPALEPHLYVVDAEEFFRRCQRMPGEIGGCAVRWPGGLPICNMYFYEAPLIYLEWHERKHCAGYSHQ